MAKYEDYINEAKQLEVEISLLEIRISEYKKSLSKKGINRMLINSKIDHYQNLICELTGRATQLREKADKIRASIECDK